MDLTHAENLRRLSLILEAVGDARITAKTVAAFAKATGFKVETAGNGCLASELVEHVVATKVLTELSASAPSIRSNETCGCAGYTGIAGPQGAQGHSSLKSNGDE